MNFVIENNKIIIKNLNDFNINHILDCGQIFRYQIDGNEAVVYSKNKKALISTQKDRVIITTNDKDYFVDFFDLSTDYSFIKKQLQKDKLVSEAIEFGYGIRILKNDTFEMIVSFIISANNNIPRIKKSIEYLCSNFGENMGEFFAFPTLKQLKKATVEDYQKAGLGYRSAQMFETIQRLTDKDIQILKNLPSDEQLKFLISLKGVGEKVANCIMLFGLQVKNVFPVDTWINKVYNDMTNSEENNRKKISKILTDKYKDLSGFAQQYLFYFYRNTH